MILYALGILPLIRSTQQKFPSLFHAWFADDGNAAGPLNQLVELFTFIQRTGPSYGYYLNPAKCKIVAPDHSISSAKKKFRKYGFDPSNFLPGHRFLGGYISVTSGPTPSPLDDFLRPQLVRWANATDRIAHAAITLPQEAYTVFTKSLQQEWQFLQRVVEFAPETFRPIENYISSSLIPALFNPHVSLVPPPRAVTQLPRKYAGLGIQNPIETKTYNFITSRNACDHLVSSLVEGHTTFSIKTHMDTVTEARQHHQQFQKDAAKTALSSFLQTQPKSTHRVYKGAATSASGSQSLLPLTLIQFYLALNSLMAFASDMVSLLMACPPTVMAALPHFP
jgi:hypothetical protein